MKLLDWVHRKLTHNSIEPMKDFTQGKASTCLSMQTLFNENKYIGEPTKALSYSNIRCQKNSKITNNEEVMFKPELLEPYDFLSIGTFGLELLNTNPPTLVLPTSFGKFTKEQEELNESDLKLTNYEFIEAEEKEMPQYASGRTSHVSLTIPMNKPAEEGDCQGRLCGSLSSPKLSRCHFN